MLRETMPGAASKKDQFGCSFGDLGKNQEFRGNGLQLFRKGMDRDELGQVATPAAERGYLIGVSTRNGHRRRIFHEHRAVTHDFKPWSSYIRNFAEDYKADMYGAFDFLLLEIAPDYLAGVARECLGRTVRELVPGAGIDDPVLAHLVRALVPALDRPEDACALLVDQVGVAIGMHLVSRHGGVAPSPVITARRLSPRQEMRAREMLFGIDGRSAPLAEVAEACGLSRSYFIRAFRETTGETPHRWLARERLALARRLIIEGRLSLQEIATAVGYTDQSHLTRKFTEAMGLPPARWRRQMM